MPSKQANDVLAMEELVHEIKENLRLKANPSRTNRSSRPSPYHIPCRSWSGEPTTATTCDHTTTKTGKQNSNSTVHNSKKNNDVDDPYELLQALLKSNNLVKEAVRRLQINNISPKQRYFYESDEDSRSPMIRMCQLEL
ncbi:proto-oncogene FRAT1-like [Sitodiplosis mosellana]|uniref:proto-oncogene FRAT1-like n=1 Tax=Sitodiplosis mosellana TaxID=263140 RepID=UPI0024448B78|nr:proto-oncogene FRAT1-like [Sitodiplosis mosellana]